MTSSQSTCFAHRSFSGVPAGLFCFRSATSAAFTLRNSPVLFRFMVLVLLVACSSAGMATASGLALDELDGRGKDDWKLVTVDGKEVVLKVSKILEGGKVEVAEPGSGAFELDSFVKIETNNKLLGVDPTVKRIDLVSGGSIQARSFVLKESVLTVETDSGELNVSLEDVQSVVLKVKEALDEQKNLVSNPSTDADKVLVKTSKGPRSVAGLIESFSNKKLSIDYQDSVRSIDLEKVIAVFPARVNAASSKKPALPKFRFFLVDRSVVYADSVSFDGSKWEVKRKGQVSRIVASHVSSIQIRSNRMQLVSDLEFKADPIEVLISEPRTTKKNKNVTGGTMKLLVADQNGGESEKDFLSGFGTHSTSRIVVQVPEGFNVLKGVVGIDRAAGRKGVCRCLIRIDGVEVFSQKVRGSKPAVPIDLKLSGKASEMELVVLSDELMDLGDWVNWANLRVLKTK